jgi:RIO kinase 1
VARPVPDWVITDDFTDVDLGVLKTGKEAEINVVERTALDGRSCLLAWKRYRPRRVRKGELAELGFQRAPTFRNDLVYRDGRNYGKRSRDRRAVERMTNYGKELVKQKWLGHEFEVMRAVWEAGADVPYPVSFDGEGMLMELVGDAAGAAPRLAQARLGGPEVRAAWDQLVDNLRVIVATGWVHADLSPFNLLWWDGRLWVIDLPQAVDLVESPHGFEFLHRDVANVCAWFARRGIPEADDPDALYGQVLSDALGAPPAAADWRP